MENSKPKILIVTIHQDTVLASLNDTFSLLWAETTGDAWTAFKNHPDLAFVIIDHAYAPMLIRMMRQNMRAEKRRHPHIVAASQDRRLRDVLLGAGSETCLNSRAKIPDFVRSQYAGQAKAPTSAEAPAPDDFRMNAARADRFWRMQGTPVPTATPVQPDEKVRSKP